jgi:excisionase family DNA binding protein
VIDLTAELAAALASPRVREALTEIMREAVRREIRSVSGDNERLIDVEEAARLLHMSVAAIRKAVFRGTIPCSRLGRRLRFRLSEIVSFSGQGSTNQARGSMPMQVRPSGLPTVSR